MTHQLSPSRRDVLKIGLIGAGVLTLGFSLRGASAFAAADPGKWPVDAFVKIGEDDFVTIVSSKVEMGQGIFTGLAMLLAEELECDWTKVKVEAAPVAAVYNSTMMPVQFTGNSTSTRTLFEPYRMVGATARAMLIAAAAKQWNVDAATCHAENGEVIGKGDGQKLSFGKLTKAAAGMPAPDKVALKDKKDWKIVGKPTPRLDSAEKVSGKAVYAIDAKLPDMLTALVRRGDVLGAKPTGFNGDKAKAWPGVKAVVQVPTGVAVIATNFWSAFKARDQLDVQWDNGPNAAVNSEDLFKAYGDMAAKPGTVVRKEGDVAAAMSGAEAITAQYEQPYLAVGSIEPMNCVVHLKDDSCEVWIGTQAPSIDRDMVVALTGLKPEQVTLHTPYLGGGFERRLVLSGADWLREAIEVAKAAKLGVPIKVMWTRIDDLAAGYYRPMWVDKVSAVLKDGKPVAWAQTGVGQSIVAGTPFEKDLLTKDGVDPFSIEGAADLPYDIPNIQIDLQTVKGDVPVQFWRSSGHSHNAFVKECFVDELAKAAQKDPVAFRAELLAKQPRALAVLKLAAEKSGWDKPPPAKTFRGVAVHSSAGSHVAIVVELTLDKVDIKINKVVIAVDCGTAVNPDQVEAQMFGGAIFGISAAMFGEISLKQGKVGQTSFNVYDMVRMFAAPPVEVYIVPSDEAPGGAGEAAVPVVIPALTNALFAATGKPIRTLPLKKAGFEFA